MNNRPTSAVVTIATAPQNMTRTAPRHSGARPSRAGGRDLALWNLCHLDAHEADQRAESHALFWRELPQLEAGDAFAGDIATECQQWLADSSACNFARRLVEGWIERALELDARIEAQSQRWRLARMDVVDRNILRLAATELLAERTPRAVVVAESVRLAARYGSERSPAFVNGIAESLAKYFRDARDEEAEPG